MAGFIPSIGLRGLYTLLAPFDTALIENVQYQCVAVRRLSDIIASGVDPQSTYYDPYGLTATQYAADLAVDVCIVTLQSGNSHFVYVPHTYLANYPAVGGVGYTSLILAISLGAIQNGLNLDYLKSRIHNDVLETIGVDSDVKIVAASLPLTVSYDTHQTIEAARKQKIGTVVTDYTKLVAAQTELTLAQQKIAELENYILTKLNP